MSPCNIYLVICALVVTSLTMPTCEEPSKIHTTRTIKQESELDMKRSAPLNLRKTAALKHAMQA